MQNRRYFQAALILSTLFLIQIPTSIAAEEDDSDEAVIVTATRGAQSVDDTLAAVSVITRQEIEASQSNSVLELLQSRVPGLDISRNGGAGAVSSVFLRGAESDHVLVLIDGVRVSSLTSGGVIWATIQPELIERIEVVRGPDSTLYGSNAIGGVIQIFTRKGGKLHASVGGGSYGTGRASLGGGGQLGEGSYHINLSHEQSDGFSATTPSSSNYEADSDGYRNSGINAGLTLPLGDETQLSLNLLHNDNRSEYDSIGSVDAYNTTVSSSGELRLDWQPRYNWSQRLILNGTKELYRSYASSNVTTSSHRFGANWQNDISLTEQQLLTLGIDVQDDSVVFDNSTDSYDKALREHAAYLQYQWHGKQYDLLLGTRGDDHNKYGQHNTGRLTLGRHIGEGRIFATYATAFKAPTFNDLYYPGFSNPDLEPEESENVEIGYHLQGFQASVYQTKLNNLIQFNWATLMPNNVGRAQLEGIELEYHHRIGEWQLNSGLTIQKTEDLDSGKQLLRRAEKKLLFSARGPLNEKTIVGIEANYTGPRIDYGDVELAAFTLINLTGEYRLDKQWVLRGRIDNLLDEQYALANGYNSPRASAYLTLSYQQ